MKRKLKIKQILKQNLNLKSCKIEDISESHRGHKGFIEGKETHLSIFAVSDDFTNLTRVDRQRVLNNLIANEFKKDLHAVTYTLLTTEEFKNN